MRTGATPVRPRSYEELRVVLASDSSKFPSTYATSPYSSGNTPVTSQPRPLEKQGVIATSAELPDIANAATCGLRTKDKTYRPLAERR